MNSKGFQRTILILTGTEYGQQMLPVLVRVIQAIFGSFPPFIRIIVADTHSGVESMSDGLQRFVRVIPLGKGVNLKELASRANRNPEVAATLKGISPADIPISLRDGSGRILPFTLAAFQAMYSRPGGVREVIDRVVRELQLESFLDGGSGNRVVTLSLMSGGNGGILPHLFAAAVKRVAKGNAALQQNLEISAIFVEPDLSELGSSPRDPANAAACLELLKRSAAGQFQFRVPGEENCLGGEQLFNRIFIAGEVGTAGRIQRDQFKRALADFMLHYATDPLSEDGVRGRLADYKIEEIDSTYKRDKLSFAAANLVIENYDRYAVAQAALTASRSVIRRSAQPANTTSQPVGAYLETLRLALPSAAETLIADLVPVSAVEAQGEELVNRVKNKTLSEDDLTGEFSKLGSQFSNRLVPQIQGRCRAAGAMAKKRVVEIVESPLKDALDFQKAAATGSSFSELFSNLADEAQAVMSSLDDEIKVIEADLKFVVQTLERALKGRLRLLPKNVGQHQAKATSRLIDLIEIKNRREAHLALLTLYQELSREAQAEAAVLVSLGTRFQEAASLAEKELEVQPAFRGEERDLVRQPVLYRSEVDTYAAERLGFSFGEVSANPFSHMIDYLEPLSSWPKVTGEEIWRAQQAYYSEKLSGLANLTIKEVLEWQANSNGRATDKELTEVDVASDWVNSVSHRISDSWVQLQREEIPSSGTYVRFSLSVPQEAASYFPQGRLPLVDEVRFAASPKEVMIVRIEAGLFDSALLNYSEFVEKLKDTKSNGSIPIIPSVLL